MTSHQYLRSFTAGLTPSMRYEFKEDFSLWRSRAKEKLVELLGLPLSKPDNDGFSVKSVSEKDGLTYTYFTFESEPDYTVPCCIVKKKEAAKAPLAICLQGHSTGMHISLGECKYDTDAASIAGGRDIAVRAAKEGMIALALEQRYMGAKGYGSKPRPACVAASEDSDANQALAAILVGRTAIGERVWDVSSAIDVVSKHFADCTDLSHIICMGNSGGGTATFYAACCDERITLAVPSCSVCTFESSILAMNHCPCNFVPSIRKYFDMGDLGALIAPRSLLVVCGNEDPIFPLDGVRESFERISSVYAHLQMPDNCRLLVGNGGHQFYPDEAWPIIHRFLNYNT